MQVKVSNAQSRAGVLYETNSGRIAAPRSFFFTNILAGTNLVIYTNGNGTITIAGTVVGGGGGGSLVTNANQFGADAVTLTIKDTPLLTNVYLYGTSIAPTGRVAIGVTNATAMLHIIPASTTSTGVLIKAQASQTADLLRFEKSDGTKEFSVRSDGAIDYADNAVISYLTGTAIVRWGAAFQSIGGALAIGTTGAGVSSPDVYMYRDSAATLQFGADAATATTQTIKAHDGSGTDKAGADFNIAGGQGTGLGLGGTLNLRTASANTISTNTLNSYSNRLSISPLGTFTFNPPSNNTNLMVLNGGVVTNSQPVLTVSQTWSNAAASFTAFRVNATNLGSGSSSLIADFQTNGTSHFFVSKDGDNYIGGAFRNAATDFEMYTDYPAARARTTAKRSIIIGQNVPGMAWASSYILSWSANTAGSADGFLNRDLTLSRDSAATLQLGADAATTTAQTLKAHDGSGTDKDGADLVLASGQGTGLANGGSFLVKTAPTSGSSSATKNNYITRQFIASGKRLVSDGSFTAIAVISVSDSIGIELFCTTYAVNGNDRIVNTDTLNISAFNIASTITAVVSGNNITNTVASANSMTTEFDVIDNADDTISIRVKPIIGISGWTVYSMYQFRINSTSPAEVTPLY